MAYNKSMNSMKRGYGQVPTGEPNTLELPKPAVKPDPPAPEGSNSPEIPSGARSRSCKVTPEEYDLEEVYKPPVDEQRPKPIHKEDRKTKNDARIKEMITQSSQNNVLKGMGMMKKFNFAADAPNNGPPIKVAVAATNTLQLHVKSPQEKSTELFFPTDGKPFKKSISISLKPRTANLSRSRLETSEDRKPSLGDSFHLTSVQKSNALQDSDDSGDDDKLPSSKKKGSVALDSLVKPAAKSIQMRQVEGKAMVPTISRLHMSHQAGTDQQDAVATEHQTRTTTGQSMISGTGTLATEGQPSAPGVPIVLSRIKPRTSSLNLRKSQLPKPPTLLPG